MDAEHPPCPKPTGHPADMGKKALDFAMWGWNSWISLRPLYNGFCKGWLWKEPHLLAPPQLQRRSCNKARSVPGYRVQHPPLPAGTVSSAPPSAGAASLPKPLAWTSAQPACLSWQTESCLTLGNLSINNDFTRPADSRTHIWTACNFTTAWMQPFQKEMGLWHEAGVTQALLFTANP